jgi:hypothetical protein
VSDGSPAVALGRRLGEDALAVDCVVTYHLNPFASGVVRFNEILANRLGVPYLGLFDERLTGFERPLLSFKVAELSEDDQRRFEALLDRQHWRVHLYLHAWAGLPLEERLVAEAEFVWCGNLEVRDRIRGVARNAEAVWTPGLLLDQRVYTPAEISVFSFGMAHKIRRDMFRRLRELLEESGRSYAIYVSSANHETRSVRDAQLVFDEMSEIFPHGLYFLGNLSDVAVFNHLRTTTFFAAFFPSGVRDNNTSVAAAMEHGSVVITNLDDYSPAHLRHMENVIDIAHCDSLPADPLVIKRMSLAAMESARERGWDRLAERFRQKGPDG